MSAQRPAHPLDRLAELIATGLGSGYSPFAPGTAGTLATIPVYLLLARLDAVGYMLALVALLALAVWAADHHARRLGQADPKQVVVDESVGLLVTLALMPQQPAFLVFGFELPWVLPLGFLLFRLFDIFKPAGVARLEGLPGGLGIVMDDFWAGVLANLSLRFLLLLLLAEPAGALP